MGILQEDAVVIKEAGGGQVGSEQTVITVNCPDKIGLGCDLCRIILLFGLSIARADFSTDEKWCYLVFWVIGKPTRSWDLLKTRLLEVCPSCISLSSDIYYFRPELQQPKPSDVFLLKFWCLCDRKALLHDVTGVLCELELTIKRVKVSTTPDERVMDLFFVTDTRELLHTRKRQEETIGCLKDTLGDSLISCEIELADGEVTYLQSSRPSTAIEEMLSSELSNENLVDPLGSDFISIMVDNSFSPSHTLVQILCQDHKGLIYDILRTLKDYNIKISYGRFFVNKSRNWEIDLFMMQADGKKITNPDKQDALRTRLKLELCHPLRVDVVSRGPDTELLVANPVELSGRGRPMVFYDITLALKLLNTCIFLVEIARHRIQGREWEVYRVLLDEKDGLTFPRSHIKEFVSKRLMGWEMD